MPSAGPTALTSSPFIPIPTPATGSLFIHFTLHSVLPAIYALAYSVSSLLLNLTATGFIAGRLLFYRYQVVKQLGGSHGRHYVSVAMVVIESAAICTSFLVVVIVAYAIGSPATNMLQRVIEPVQVSLCFCTYLASRIRTGTNMHFSAIRTLHVVVEDSRSPRFSSFCGSHVGRGGICRPRQSRRLRLCRGIHALDRIWSRT